MNDKNAAVDGRKSNVIPTRRNAPPKVDVVNMADVPEPPISSSRGVADTLYIKIKALKTGTALKAEFETDGHGDYVRTKLRALAKKDKQFMSSSRSADGKTRYFWLEKL